MADSTRAASDESDTNVSARPDDQVPGQVHIIVWGEIRVEKGLIKSLKVVGGILGINRFPATLVPEFPAPGGADVRPRPTTEFTRVPFFSRALFDTIAIARMDIG